MDFLKKAQEAIGGENNNQNNQNTNTNTNTDGAAPAQGSSNNTGGQDYGDKAFGFISKKAGYNVDEATSEKITDGARGLYEKATGNQVNSKYSN